MKFRQILILFVLIVLVWLFKLPLSEILTTFLCDLKIGDWCRIVNEATRFLGIFVFPFLLSLLFLYYWWKYRKNYEVISQWTLGSIIIGALTFSFHSLYWYFPDLWEILPLLNGFWGVLILYEAFFNTSLVLLFISLIFFAFGKK